MKIIDSHCHIHDENFPIEMSEVFDLSRENSVEKAICVGVDLGNSKRAVEFCEIHAENPRAPQLFATVGIHPHEAEKIDFENDLRELRNLAKNPKVVAIGEIGLDYFYENSPREIQQKALFEQLKIAKEFDLPVAFHVRNAFDDFWRVLDDFEAKFGKIRGVVHSFTDSAENLEAALARDFFIGVNGISTFVKSPEELEMFAKIPLEKIILETDAPFLAPKVKRGRKNQPAWTRLVAEDLAEKREIPLEKIAEITSKNTEKLFDLR